MSNLSDLQTLFRPVPAMRSSSRATDWLAQRLADGRRVRVGDLLDEARTVGISTFELINAARAIEAGSYRGGPDHDQGGLGAVWSLHEPAQRRIPIR